VASRRRYDPATREGPSPRAAAKRQEDMTSADDLLRSVKGGDPDYDGIYRAYGRLMYVAALRAYHQNNRIVDAQDVGDVVHEAFLQIMDRKLLTPDTKSIGGLLSTVAYRRALDHLRRGDRHADLDIDDLADHADVEDPYAAIEDELERTQTAPPSGTTGIVSTSSRGPCSGA
jgi:DNA-directed RNA polymerase specialized sigma24 family protein